MKLAFYNDFNLGVIKSDRIIDASDAVADCTTNSPQVILEMVIENWGVYSERILTSTDEQDGVELDSVTLCSAVPRPGQLVCLAGNYIEPDHPDKGTFNAFLKSNTSLMGHRSEVELPSAEASVFHFEPELAVVMGKRATKLSPDEALDYVFGYTQFIDVSARGLPGGFFLGKSWHTFGPMGPALVTADEVGDANELPAKMWVNGALKHDFNTNEMGRHIPELLAEVTSVLTLEPGDVVSTGTHHYALSPIQDGDKLTLAVDRMGPALEISVKDERKRTWER
ncbi:MAG: fumarylacetoacetate hydrolase family protein [Candidatus Latescibacteria bacterium]|nr:fumarylacetoacetate hydrolase family protein [Candidatus Latescibacterota bacterium]